MARYEADEMQWWGLAFLWATLKNVDLNQNNLDFLKFLDPHMTPDE